MKKNSLIVFILCVVVLLFTIALIKTFGQHSDRYIKQSTIYSADDLSSKPTPSYLLDKMIEQVVAEKALKMNTEKN